MGDAVKVAAAGLLRARGQRLTGMLTRASRPDLELLAEHLGAGTLRPLVERTYPLAEVPAAVRYVGEGHARGKVVIAVAA
jgi:NADPH:quinone reductase-like Zn-dependent oxidoreductase